MFIGVLPVTLIVAVCGFKVPPDEVFAFLKDVSCRVFVIRSIFVSFLCAFTMPAKVLGFYVIVMLSVPSTCVLGGFYDRLLGGV